MSWLMVLLVLFLSMASNKKTNIKKESVSIIIPAYNEEENVAKVIGVVSVIDYVDEVIVVDDGSRDKTSEEAKLAGATVFAHTSNQGKGSAIKTGFKHSNGDIIVFIDADIHNLTKDKVDSIVMPILEGKSDITKTKFARESGRVTELTAKPLLRFFFPEITFDQPLSGQFAGKRSVLNKMRFERDYGVDVGIVLDADAHGINITEVDIGEIKHDLSPLSNLHEMANEVVRTIVDRALEYGRVTMIDTLGNYIRSAILGLSLIILGLFTIFFVQGIPLEIGAILSIIGFIVSLYYLFRLIRSSIYIYNKKGNKRNLLKSFVKMHFPVIVSGVVLIIMISTFLSAASITDGEISIEPTSRHLIIFPSADDQQTMYVRGPYTVDSALENELNIIRMPEDARRTLELEYGDIILIRGESYTINETRLGENNIIRMPSNVREYLDIAVRDVISDGKIRSLFEKTEVSRLITNSTFNNTSDSSIDSNLTNNTPLLTENFIINSKASNGSIFEVYINNQLFTKGYGVFDNNKSYTIFINGVYGDSITPSLQSNDYLLYYGDHIIKIKLTNKTSTIKQFKESNFGEFLSFNI
ncbi:glycosyltransferase [Methanobrevibacter filiformis]|uniref:Glucosyl-3-phosphoglycerate synthase n=1 Tax=Methanobrevibacter filiformis TaxID=55758 RepID=A0A166CZB6_9EURY|nr:glycosyltransferase [Methanobrevibacter filiformis]KZX17707.1 glucosyl-3-phosphoglycerate synthase [Methanobrevibacter filiformis]